MNHVGRPSNKELKQRRNKKIIKILLPSIIILFVLGFIIININGGINNLLGNSVTKEYYCEDSTYQLTGTLCKKTETKSAYILGDIDNNQKINTADALLIQKYNNKVIELNDFEQAAADTNNDNVIDNEDIIEIQKVIVKDDSTSSVESVPNNRVGIDYVCAKDYKLNGKVCTKEIVKDALVREISNNDSSVDVNISLGDNKSKFLKNSRILLNINFKLNNGDYYYTWTTYSKDQESYKSECLKVATGKVERTLKMTNPRYGIVRIYNDKSCKNIVKEVKSDEYNYDYEMTLNTDQTATSLSSDKVVNVVPTFKRSDSNQKYYYVWKTYNDDKIVYTSNCLELKENMSAWQIKMKQENKGVVTTYSDSSCKNKLDDISTQKYVCSNCQDASNVDVNISLGDNKSKFLKNSKILLNINFKLKNGNYYYTWTTYSKDQESYKSECLKVATGKVERTLKMTNPRYGVVRIYNDKSCKNIVKEVKSDEYNYDYEMTLKADQTATSLSSDKVVNVVPTFKRSDANQKYYYIWKTYNDDKVVYTSNCLELKENMSAWQIKMKQENKGVVTTYSDSSCKNKLDDISTQKYACSNCKIKLSITPTDQNSSTVLNYVETKKFTVKTANLGSHNYYYTWKDSTKTAGSCTALKSSVTTKLTVNSKKYGIFTVYSDKKCSKKVDSIKTNTYSLSTIIWPVVPQFQLLEHDKMVHRIKHYVYGNSEWHEGLDITTPVGTPVYAVADGTVRSHNTYSGANEDQDYGNVLFVQSKINGKNYSVAYAHLKYNPFNNSKVQFKKGQKITKGQLIGYSGITGGSRIPHLHIDFNLINSSNNITGTHLDPLNVLPKVDYSKLKSTVKKGEYTSDQFPNSSVELYNNMRNYQNKGQTWKYPIYAIAKSKVNSIPKGAKVELISRTKAEYSKVTVKYKNKTYYNLSASNFNFNY